MFKHLHIRFQTAAMIPAPFAHFYTLTARPAFTNFLQLEFSITYPDREELDEEDITGEGFTLHDDFSWSGRLPNTWLTVVNDLLERSQLVAFDENQLDEGDDYFEVTIDRGDGPQTGTPADKDAFQYPIQELIQAIYEAGEKERPFLLTYLNVQKGADAEVRIKASFAERTLKAEMVQDRRSRNRTLPWSDLEGIMSVIYAIDYDPETAFERPPSRDGHYLNLGGDEWYDVGDQPAIQKLFKRLL